jgi:hypothetical protein
MRRICARERVVRGMITHVQIILIDGCEDLYLLELVRDRQATKRGAQDRRDIPTGSRLCDAAIERDHGARRVNVEGGAEVVEASGRGEVLENVVKDDPAFALETVSSRPHLLGPRKGNPAGSR